MLIEIKRLSWLSFLGLLSTSDFFFRGLVEGTKAVFYDKTFNEITFYRSFWLLLLFPFSNFIENVKYLCYSEQTDPWLFLVMLLCFQQKKMFFSGTLGYHIRK